MVVFYSIEWLLLFFVFISSILSVLHIASLLSFYAILIKFMEPSAIVPIATIFHISMNITKMVLFKDEINWKVVKNLVISSIPGLIAGSMLIAYIPQEAMRCLISFLVIIFLLVEIFKIKTYEIKNSTASIVTVGLSYGFFSGLVGSAGIIRAPLLMKMSLTKESLIGTAAAASLFSNIIKIVSYSANGLLTKYVIINGLASIIVGIIGAQIGKRLLNRVNDKYFKRILHIGLLISALSGLRFCKKIFTIW